MMTNAVLRKRAFHLCWQNRDMLWALFLLLAVINVFWIMMNTYVIKNALLTGVLGFVYQLAVTPVTMFGMYYIMLRLVHGKKARIPMLFDLYKPPFALQKVYTASLVMSVFSFLILLINLFQLPKVNTFEQAVLVLVVGIAAIILIFWLMMRLFLFPFLFMTKQNESIWALVKTSFRQMKGYVGHLIWFGITVYFPVILLLMALSALLSSFAVKTELPLLSLVSAPFTALVLPYVNLALTAYANELLREADGKKTKAKEWKGSTKNL